MKIILSLTLLTVPMYMYNYFIQIYESNLSINQILNEGGYSIHRSMSYGFNGIILLLEILSVLMIWKKELRKGVRWIYEKVS